MLRNPFWAYLYEYTHLAVTIHALFRIVSLRDTLCERDNGPAGPVALAIVLRMTRLARGRGDLEALILG